MKPNGINIKLMLIRGIAFGALGFIGWKGMEWVVAKMKADFGEQAIGHWEK